MTISDRPAIDLGDVKTTTTNHDWWEVRTPGVLPVFVDLRWLSQENLNKDAHTHTHTHTLVDETITKYLIARK